MLGQRPTSGLGRFTLPLEGLALLEGFAAAGLLSSIIANDTTISNDTGTTMTGDNATGQAYFNVWKGSATDKVKEDQMKQVILHFESHGYTIYRNTNASTTTIFDWKIEW